MTSPPLPRLRREDVLPLPPAVREFLLAMAARDRVPGPLAAAAEGIAPLDLGLPPPQGVVA